MALGRFQQISTIAPHVCFDWHGKKYLFVYPICSWPSLAQSCRRNLDVSQVGYTVALAYRSVLLFLPLHSKKFTEKNLINPKMYQCLLTRVCASFQREKWPPWPLKALSRGLSCDSLFYRPDDYRLPRDQWWSRLLFSNKSRTRQLRKLNSDFFHLPSAHWTRLLFIGTLQTFSFYQTLQVIIGGCSCLCVTERLILVIATPLLWDLTRFRYDEHVVYPLTIQLRKLKSQNLVLIYTAEIINALGLFNHLEPMNRIDSNFRADGFVRSCFGEPQCQNIHREARKYQPRGINFESIEVWYKTTEAFWHSSRY